MRRAAAFGIPAWSELPLEGNKVRRARSTRTTCRIMAAFIFVSTLGSWAVPAQQASVQALQRKKKGVNDRRGARETIRRSVQTSAPITERSQGVCVRAVAAAAPDRLRVRHALSVDGGGGFFQQLRHLP